MHPIICKLGPITIYAYGFMMVLGFIIATALAGREAKRANINPEIFSSLFIVVFIYGIIGARFLYVVRNMDYYSQYPLEAIMIHHGGLSWFGGLFMGIISAMIYLKIKRLPVYKIFDLSVPYLALAQAIGRIGCLLNGCCVGKPTDFGIYFPADDAILIPTQLYSSLFLILIFIILRVLQQKPHKEGQIFYVYLLLYTAKRFFMEFWRQNDFMVGVLSPFQVISLIVFCAALIKFIQITRSKSSS